MNKIWILFVVLAFVTTSALSAQKGKHKGKNKGGDKSNSNINININIGDDDDDHKGGKHDHYDDYFHDNGWHHGHHKHERKYKNSTVIWFFGPGDIYECQGKNKKQKIVIFDQVCLRLTTNIGFMFGLIGDIRLNLDTKKEKMKPERYDKIKIEIDLLDEELKSIEIKKNKIKLRLGTLAKDKDN